MKNKYIKQTSPDKVNGKLVKYKQGDCISIKCENGSYLAAIISGKFNVYYDISLIDFCETSRPKEFNFFSGRFFGTRFGSWEELSYAVDKRMIDCKYIDSNTDIKKISNINLIPGLGKAAYGYIKNIAELLTYYQEEIAIRKEKTINAERFPDLAFVSKHLIDIECILE